MRGHIPPVLSKVASVLPLLPLEIVSRRLLANAMAARPSFAARLGEHGGRTFAIDPLDCPFVFLITPGGEGVHVRLVRDLSESAYDARIAAPLIVLCGMIDGTYDGDALFFSRDLTIQGDTGAVLALRNAIENAELDPSSVLGLPKAVHRPFNRATEFLFGQLRRALDAPEPTTGEAYLP
jgi:predicted lipid carrier protein YhbT